MRLLLHVQTMCDCYYMNKQIIQTSDCYRVKNNNNFSATIISNIRIITENSNIKMSSKRKIYQHHHRNHRHRHPFF